MKSSLRYLMLWQKKRNELPINDDPQTDWMEMQSLLDMHLPVSSEKTSRFKKIKVLPALFIAFSAAAMVYTASRVVINIVSKYHTKHHHTGQNHRFNKALFSADSLYADSLIENTDSTTKQLVAAAATDTAIAPAVNKNAITSLPLNAGHAGGAVVAGKNSGAPASLNKNQALFSHRANSLASNAIITGNRLNGGSGVLLQTTKNSNSSALVNNSHRSTRSRGQHQTIVADHSLNGNASEQNLQGDADDNGYRPLQVTPPHISFNNSISNLAALPLLALNNSLVKKPSPNQSAKNNNKTAKDKTMKVKNSGTSNIDWGILTGVNSSGSFTPKAQNANLYGSLPVDLYLGLFATYHLNGKWRINVQTQIYSPQTINTSYTHANGSNIDSTQSLKIMASRKVYNINVPMHIVYNVTDNISIKAGPVIGFPVKQINTNSSLQPAGIRSDSAYYAKSIAILNQTKYEQGVNLGFSGGGSVKAGRFIFEATYLKSITGYKIVSDWGSYKSNNGTLQFTISFKLNKSK